MAIARKTATSRMRISLLGAVLAVGLVIGYEVRHARALGIPTLTTMAYSGSLMTFGAPDNSTHLMTLALFVAGANDGGLGSAACEVQQVSITCVNGQFSIPLTAACELVVQQNPNIQVEVTIDGSALGLISVTAVPYAVESGTAAGLPVAAALPASPSAGAVVYNTATTSLSVFDGSAWRLFSASGSTGNSWSSPASSCLAVLQSNSAATDGPYWLKTSATDVPFVAWCSMSTGGWTLVVRANDQGDENLDTLSDYNGPPQPTGNSAKISHQRIQNLVSASANVNPVRFDILSGGSILATRYVSGQCPWTGSYANRNQCAAWATTPSSTTHVTICGTGTMPALNNGGGGEWPTSAISWPYQDGTCLLNGGFATDGNCCGAGFGDAWGNSSEWSAATGVTTTGRYPANIWVQ